ncbi:Cytochrome c biogenesis ATP-binding export protein CcmA [Shimia sp. SK013]|uniref:heme ABC exporter ATP-binding protein CcmA n=1 Tax=Shimia sp. SK013 TaxID=1389006 RepID=UPI0006B61DF4|nr:heme ABC exporter ATP-binding protein CcmA [Shimia sp. SK013]KPA22301.1 Cytochrome c biogenesis ATP-binding export protein CcmA [Shimia sp. SK013]
MTLTVFDLTVSRGGIAVLQGLSFELAPGRALILRGPNGIGKTTLLRTVAGLQPALSGTVTAPEESIAYAAHSDGLKAMLSVEENLHFWARVFGQPKIDIAVQAFELKDLLGRPAGTLSAGQKRRLGLARLLVTGRPIWILDEPTVSLDAQSVARFADAVRRHLAGGGSVLIATHIDLGLDGDVLDVGSFKASGTRSDPNGFDESFL